MLSTLLVEATVFKTKIAHEIKNKLLHYQSGQNNFA